MHTVTYYILDIVYILKLCDNEILIKNYMQY